MAVRVQLYLVGIVCAARVPRRSERRDPAGVHPVLRRVLDVPTQQPIAKFHSRFRSLDLIWTARAAESRSGYHARKKLAESRSGVHLFTEVPVTLYCLPSPVLKLAACGVSNPPPTARDGGSRSAGRSPCSMESGWRWAVLWFSPQLQLPAPFTNLESVVLTADNSHLVANRLRAKVVYGNSQFLLP